VTTIDKQLDKAEAFQAEFKVLVRKYVPATTKEEDIDLLMLLQERTSVFNPYVWSDD
jgi:hypothetical protein